jgi:hypothetical protein
MPQTIVETKFYHFDQNNSGGSFEVNDKVAHNVIIEAINPQHANQIAEGIGIYFDGCESGMDCSCCGDRWPRASDYDAAETPTIYGKPIEERREIFCRVGEPYCHVYYLNGDKKTYVKEK